MAMGERTPVALLGWPGVWPSGGGGSHHQPGRLPRLKNWPISNCPANWMCAAGHEGEDAILYNTVKAVGMELCPELQVNHSGGQRLHVDENPLER